jgi:hypothetical protein
LVTRVEAIDVSTLVRVTDAPGMTPPEESVTVPTTVPIEDCASAIPAPESESSTTNNRRRLVIQPFLLERPDCTMLYR